ncbi:MAG TPA: hypothetical protein VN950_19080 [Terriglobales bacterium]|nr:hypothetical protein [Terriglobales bacterium]
MQSVTEQFSELRTAAIASGKITATQIIEATKGIVTDEQRLSVLKEMAEEHKVPLPESVSEKIAHLTEKIVTSGKVTAVQINESMKNCSTESERLEALQSFAIAKKIGVTRVERKNGAAMNESAAPVRPTKEERIASYARKMKVSFREAALFLGYKDIGPKANESNSVIEARAERWRKYCGVISEADVRSLAEKGLEPV